MSKNQLKFVLLKLAVVLMCFLPGIND